MLVHNCPVGIGDHVLKKFESYRTRIVNGMRIYFYRFNRPGTKAISSMIYIFYKNALNLVSFPFPFFDHSQVYVGKSGLKGKRSYLLIQFVTKIFSDNQFIISTSVLTGENQFKFFIALKNGSPASEGFTFTHTGGK